MSTSFVQLYLNIEHVHTCSLGFLGGKGAFVAV